MRITPWRDQHEWERVRTCLYSTDPEHQTLGIDRIAAWTCRGRVAHAAQSTSALTVALKTRGSQLEQRMVLAMALTRFVNGLLDPAQQAVHAISMVALARQINLPDSFVELRHATTHDMLPSLPVLQQAAAQAKAWLWQHYWAPRVERPAAAEDKDALHATISDLVKQWRKLRRETPNHELKQGGQDPLTRQSLALLKQVGTVKQTKAAAEVWVACLCNSKCMLRQDSPHALWWPLLDRVLACQPHFRQVMLECGAAALGQRLSPPGLPPPPADPVLDRLRDWMWLLASRDVDDAMNPLAVIKALCLERDASTAELLRRLASVEGFEEAPRLAKLRDVHIQVQQPRAHLMQSERQVIEQTGSGAWTKIASSAQPIGFIIQADN